MTLDAELIELCAQHIVNLHAYNNGPSKPLGAPDPLWDAYVHTRDLIGQTKAVTLEGMVAKARAAMVEATSSLPGGKMEPNGTPAEYWSWDLVQDLLRLGKAA